MDFIIWVLLALFIWLGYVYISEEKRKVNLPGPKGLPILGCLLQLDKKFHMISYKWGREYGRGVYFSILKDHFVQISDVKLVKELFSLDQITGRPLFDIFLLFEGEPLGLVNSQGELWEAHRRFTLRQLRDFGFGKNTMEMLIRDEVHDLLATLGKREGPISGIKELFSLAVVNSLWTVVSGKRYNQDDPNLRAISSSLNRAVSEAANSGGIIFFLPWPRYIAPEKTGYTATRKAFEQLKAFVVEAVQEHKKTFQPDTCRDFIDVYLKEMQSVKDNRSTFYGEAGEKQLAAVVADLFFAGTDTTSTTLAWAILYLATHQEVQKRLQAEISLITSDSRDVSVSDRPNMHYLLATIDEVLRFSSILPAGVAHQALSDVSHQGINFPKGTVIQANLFYIHHNPDLWGDPENFRPERFLVGDQKTYKKSENLMGFSTGRRQCLGETLARDTIFLFMANIFQNFTVECDPNSYLRARYWIYTQSARIQRDIQDKKLTTRKLFQM